MQIFNVKYLIFWARQKRQIQQYLGDSKCALFMAQICKFFIFAKARIHGISYENFTDR